LKRQWEDIHRLIVINFTWAFSRLAGGIIQNILAKYADKGDSKINHSMTEILYRTTTYTIWILGILLRCTLSHSNRHIDSRSWSWSVAIAFGCPRYGKKTF
jgi:hypothetical protein